MKRIVLSLLVISSLYAQSFYDLKYKWSNPFNGGGEANVDDVSRDQDGNVYMVGRINGTADFDPSGAIANETSTGNVDLFFAKYDSVGNFIWVKQIDMFASGWGVYQPKIKVKNNFIHIVGTYIGTADFDPSAAVANMTTPGNLGPYILKYDLNGNYIWSKTLGSLNNDHATDLDVDNTGNVYVSFVSGGVGVDFDPGAAVLALPISWNDGAFAKFDPAGNLLFAKSIPSSSGGWHPLTQISVDASDNIYVSGFTDGTSDLDPGPGIVNVSSTGNPTSYVARYDNTGNYVWHGIYDGGYVTELRVNKLDNVFYVSGVYTIPSFDSDILAGVSTLASAGGNDGFLAKYDLNGSIQWSRTMGGGANDSYQDFDFYRGSQLVVTTNYSSNPVDADPSASVTSHPNNGGNDLAISRFGADGAYYTSIAIGAGSDDLNYAITTNPKAQSVVIGGTFNLTMDFDGYAPIANETAVGLDGYLACYRPCGPSTISGYYSDMTPIGPGPCRPICEGDIVNLSLIADYGATIYWYGNGTLLGTGNSIIVGPLDSSVTITAIDSISGASSEDYWGYSYSYYIPVTELNVTLTTSEDTLLCDGSADLLGDYELILGCSDSLAFSWSPNLGDSLAYTVSPTTTTEYWFYVESFGNSGYSCKDSASVLIVATENLNLNVTASDTVICEGESVTLDATGATNINWDNSVVNNIAFTPTSTTTYTVIGDDGETCSDTVSITIQVNSYPNVTITAADSIVCNGESITLTASGASSYSWSGGISNGVSFTPSSSTAYTVIGSNNGCNDTASINITVTNPPTISMVSDSSICELTEITIIPNVIGGTLPYDYLWSDLSTNSTLTVTEPGIYSLTVTDSMSCSSTDSIEIVAICPCSIYVPSAFTPTNDELNEKFKAIGKNVSIFNIEIYNRWGELIYSSSDIKQGWTGDIKGTPAPQGVYAYKVYYECIGSKVGTELVGKVTIIK